MDLLTRVKAYIEAEKLIRPGDRVLAAVSGGLDSMVLADILLRLSQPLRFTLAVASFNHGLRPEAGADLDFVAAWADGRGLPFFAGMKDIAALSRGVNVEDVGRRERYAFLRAAAVKWGAGAIATAHHRGDQAETVLLHLLRGGGVTGLAGIRPSRDGLIRPLLCAGREDIAAYAQGRRISHREDATNADVRYLRNRVRHELLPQLAAYNPRVAEQLNDTADICREEDALLDEMAEIALAELWSTEDLRLAGPGFAALAPALQRRVLRKAWQLLAGDLPELSFNQVRSALALKEGQSYDLPRGLKVWRRGDLCFGRLRPDLPLCEDEWPLLTDGCWHELPGLGCSYRAAWAEGENRRFPREGEGRGDLAPDMALLPGERAQSACWRSRRPGDWLVSSGKAGRRKVKDVFIDAHVPPHRRETWPLLVQNGETLWLPGLRRTNIAASTNNVLIKVRFSDKI